MEARPRVLVCDDSLGFPTLVQTWLRDDGRFDVIGLVKTGTQARDAVEAERPDLIVLDLLLPDSPDPADLVRRLREAHPPLRVLMVSSLHPEALEDAGRAAGADGVCNKGAAAAELAERLYAIASGEGSSTQNRLP